MSITIAGQTLTWDDDRAPPTITRPRRPLDDRPLPFTPAPGAKGVKPKPKNKTKGGAL